MEAREAESSAGKEKKNEEMECAKPSKVESKGTGKEPVKEC